MSAWSTLLPLFAPLHLYSSVGGVDIYTKMVLSKICRSQHLNPGLDRSLQGNEKYIPISLTNQRNSAFWSFYFDLKYIPTLHFAYFLCSVLLMLTGTEIKKGDDISSQTLLCASVMSLYTITCCLCERKLQKGIQSQLKTENTLKTINSTLTKNNSDEHIQAPDLNQTQYDKIDTVLFPPDYRLQRDTIFYRLHLTILAILIIYCIQTPYTIVLTIFLYTKLLFLPKTDWYSRTKNNSRFFNRYLHLIVIFGVFLYLFSFYKTGNLPELILSYFKTIPAHLHLLFFFIPYTLITPPIIHRKVKHFKEILDNYESTSIMAQYLSQERDNTTSSNTTMDSPSPNTQPRDSTSPPKKKRRRKRK